MRYHAGLLILFLASLSGRCQAPEAVAPKLLRTVQIGALQDITVEEIKKIASDGNNNYVVYHLARSALLVLQQDPPTATPFGELLDGALNTMVLDGNSNAQPSSVAPGFGRKELVLTLVYAMVMSGNQEHAIDNLEKHLWTGSKYKHAVVLQALRNIGTQRAIGLIQKYVEKGDDRNLGENTLADEDLPVLFELHDRWNLVPPAQRTRDQLAAIVRSGCDQRTAMAAYWLGFFPPNPDPAKEQGELNALRAFVEKKTPGCGVIDHVIALKSLGLRSPESMEFWATFLRRYDKNVWERHQAALNAWSRFGRNFAPVALDLLRTEPAQYIQWELLHGNFLTRKRLAFRSVWDIWIPSTLQLYLNHSDERGAAPLPQADVNRLLGWLESGARPQDRWVQNHMLYGLASYVTGDNTLRFLRLFTTWPQRDQNWWIIENLRDPQSLPLLRYWSSLPTEDYQSQVIHNLVSRLESQQSRGGPRKASACCLPTKACLLTHVGAAPVDFVIHSETEAKQWLTEAGHQEGEDLRITFTDELQRIAEVDLKNGERQHWEYIYDCWRRAGNRPQ